MTAKLYKILLISGIAAIFVAIPLFWFYWQPVKQLEVDFLDVGQGDAILIKAPAGQNILIDGGPDRSVVRELSKNLAWWDRQIDLMILTHPHDDHVTGLVDVIKRYKVKQIFYTGVVHNGPNYLAWLNLVRDKKIKLVIIDHPQTVKLGKDCNLEIIYPISSLLGKEVDNLNNSSLVGKLVYGKSEFLFVGDIEKDVEDKLLNLTPLSPLPASPAGGLISLPAQSGRGEGPLRPPRLGEAGRSFSEARGEVDLSADVLKVAHHGSDTGSSEDFLNAINPKIAIIEVGKDNDFGHPSLRVLKRLERLSVKIFRTDLDGTVRLVSDGSEITKKDN